VTPYNIKGYSLSHSWTLHGEVYDDWHSAVFRLRRNCSVDGAERTDGGRAFHARAAATVKARSSNVVRRVDGIISVDVEALRRRWREPTSAVQWRVSARYDGAVPLRQRTREHITGTEFPPKLSANVVHGGVELCALTSSPRTRDERRRWRQTAAVVEE